MRCSRKDCDSIMCHTYVDKIGYICHNCQSEFSKYIESKNLGSKLHQGELHRELESFMNTPSGYYVQGEEMTPEEFFNLYSRSY